MQQLRLAFCASSDDRPGYLALCQVALVDGKPPEWVQLVPAGKKIKALDGREFSNTEPQAIINAFDASPLDIPIDWNHAEEMQAPQGKEAPAAGWIDKMEIRSGSVWGHVNWTPRGAESLITKESRYLSPALLLDKVTKIVKEIVSAGLVNKPALTMPAIARAEPETEKIMDPKLLEILGLAPEATQEQILEAVMKLKSDPATELQEVKTELEATRTKLNTTEIELTNARNANPELDKFVPRADYDAAVARAKTLEDEKTETAKAAHDNEVTLTIDAALRSGKIAPATKDFYVETCSTVEGLEKFRKFVENAPVIGDVSNLDTKPSPTAKGTANADELAVASTFGMTREEYIKARDGAFS